MEGFLESGGLEDQAKVVDGISTIRIEFEDGAIAHNYLMLATQAHRRKFDEEQHSCPICMRDLLGSKFFFMSGCEHYFCTECITDMVVAKINDGQISQLTCCDQNCMKMFNDRDVKNLNLDEELLKKYEKLSLDNAIA